LYVSCVDPCRASLSLLSFPTRRSSDLRDAVEAAVVQFVTEVQRELEVVAVHGCPRHVVRQREGAVTPQVGDDGGAEGAAWCGQRDRKSTRLNSSHVKISYAVFCLKKKN